MLEGMGKRLFGVAFLDLGETEAIFLEMYSIYAIYPAPMSVTVAHDRSQANQVAGLCEQGNPPDRQEGRSQAGARSAKPTPAGLLRWVYSYRSIQIRSQKGKYDTTTFSNVFLV